MKDLTKIKEFLQSVGADLSKLDSEGKYHGYLSIRNNSSLTSLTFPEGMAIGGDLSIRYNSSLTSLTFPEGMAIGGYLSISDNSSLTSLTFPEGMAIGGDLYISDNSSLTSLTFPEGMAIGGDISIRNNSSLTSLTFPEGMAIGGDLSIRYNSSLTSLTFPEGMAIGGYLSISDNSSLTSLTFPEGMAIGGDLYISDNSSLTSLTFPEGMAIGGDISIRNNSSLTSLTFPEGMAIGCYLSIRYNSSLKQKKWNVRESVDDGYIWTWRGRRYIKADGVFMRLLNRRGNVCKVSYIGRNRETYLVTDGAGKWAHGDTLEEAKRDLIYKISNRDTSRYNGLTLESELTHEEAIEAYRVITGACSAGTRHFCESILPKEEVREKYTVAKIIELTAGNYGSDKFREFFTR